MNRHKAVAVVAAALLVAGTLPALNWAQETDITIEEKISNEVDGQLQEQELVIRRAEEQARMQAKQAAKQAADAEKILIKAAKADRKFQIFFNGGEGSVPPLGVKIHEASRAVRDAKDDEAREKATKELASALDEYFEEDMKARGKELDNIRARLANLERQLDRRREKKQEIIDLQMKVALNEADGLGFYSEARGTPFDFGMSPPPATWGMPGEIKIATPVRVEAAGPPVYVSPPAPPAAPAPAASPAPADTPR
jgi:hypothetical protein